MIHLGIILPFILGILVISGNPVLNQRGARGEVLHRARHWGHGDRCPLGDPLAQQSPCRSWALTSPDLMLKSTSLGCQIVGELPRISLRRRKSPTAPCIRCSGSWPAARAQSQRCWVPWNESICARPSFWDAHPFPNDFDAHKVPWLPWVLIHKFQAVLL